MKKKKLLVEVSQGFVSNINLKITIFMTLFREKKKRKKCLYLIYLSIHPSIPTEREREVLGKIYKNVCIYECIGIIADTHQNHHENTLTLTVGVISHSGAARSGERREINSFLLSML